MILFAKSELPLGTKKMLQESAFTDLLHKYIVVTAMLLLAVIIGNAVVDHFIGELIIAMFVFS